MKISIAIFSFLALFLTGCASTETAKEAQNKSVSRVYQYAFTPVYNAMLAAARTKNLGVVDKDEAKGKLVLSHGSTLLGWDEGFSVFVKSVTVDSTEVEVVNKPFMTTLNYPHNWQKMLLDQVDIELRAGK